ncbi:MAG: pyruvate kinase, partial [bacterium]|nr:pyruvate kinase [bacterium]
GPKVRASQLPEGGVALADGTSIRLEPGSGPSSAECVYVEYENLLTDLQVGDRIAFGDGATVAQVEDKDGSALHALVTHGGVLRGRPGVHIPSDRLRLTTPTSEDLRLLDAFIEAGVDMVALSFVRSGHDVRRVGTEASPRGPLVVAKIETRAAIQNLEGILEAAGAIMIARGDLGVEFPIEELPHLQKRIIRECIAHGRPAITATQMLETMIEAPTPTRAEASDVANAVFDG